MLFIDFCCDFPLPLQNFSNTKNYLPPEMKSFFTPGKVCMVSGFGGFCSWCCVSGFVFDVEIFCCCGFGLKEINV